MMRNFRSVVALAVLVALLVMSVLSASGFAPQQVGAPLPLTNNGQRTVILYPATAIVTGTTNSSSPRLLAPGDDASATRGWANVDVFMAATVAGSGVVTITPQFSADCSNWTNADFNYWTGSAVAQSSYQRVLNSSTTVEYASMPAAGECLRVQMVVTGGTVTPTVYATWRK